jgi:putative transposase
VTVHPFIEAEKRDGHNVKRACELLQVSRTAFYARCTGKPGPRAVRDAELTEKIAEVHDRSRGTYGVPRIHAVLQRQGEDCGRRRIARLMRTAGLQGRHRRRRQLTTIPDPRAAVRPDLVVRDFAPDPGGLDTRWCGSGSRRESHPPAPTEPCVTVSRYTALVTLITRNCGTGANAQTFPGIAV